MVSESEKAFLPHLFSALVTSGLAVLAAVATTILAVHLENQTLSETAREPFLLKDQGLAFQRCGLQASNVLLLYGSSELSIGGASEMAGNFFRNAPTGFRVSTVGRPGSTSITVLQRLGALASDARDKKIAISLSPSWFFVPVTNPYAYQSNFSILAASEMAFHNNFDRDLKQAIATRMLEFPRTLSKSPILYFALRRVASGKWIDQLAFQAIQPLGELQIAIFKLQDHLAAILHIWTKASEPASLNREARADKQNKDDFGIRGFREKLIPNGGDTVFLARMGAAQEWADLDLLLRGLSQLHVRALVLSMPLDGASYQSSGISVKARQVFYERVRTAVGGHDFALAEFEDHDADTDFLDDHHYHLTAKGWRFYDQVIDDFFHDRLSQN